MKKIITTIFNNSFYTIKLYNNNNYNTNCKTIITIIINRINLNLSKPRILITKLINKFYYIINNFNNNTTNNNYNNSKYNLKMIIRYSKVTI